VWQRLLHGFLRLRIVWQRLLERRLLECVRVRV
jgi:hypothetical protein